MPEERLQKVLAAAGVASRRAAEALVAAGRVTVDGRVAVVGERVDPERAVVAVDGRPVGPVRRHVYLVLAKPMGVTSTVADRHAARTVLELVPAELRAEAGRLYPVGRLDRDSEGLLLLTNDGAWAERLLHPRYEVEREYSVGLRRPLGEIQVDALTRGIGMTEGLARLEVLRPASAVEVRRLVGLLDPPPPPLTWYRATLRQGWKRQLRRMFVAVGAPIARLVRVRIGTIRLAELRTGETRQLSGREIGRLAALARDADRRGSRLSGPERP
ncbi:MAG: hypothetical protein A2X23_05740 [Chloroflexi bacterium GWC2_73_18]|nr:MAG: hypothetical protein A2X23_05740 [Chloroflexi bacterium GWC2_73_18]